MKILVLNGSPRVNGNTRAVLKIMEEKLASKGDIEFLDVCKLKLSGCIACDTCKRNGGFCFATDDTNDTIKKVAQADLIIFGTPVYWWGMSAQLKMVVDKFYSKASELAERHKKIGVVSVGGDELNNPQYQLIDKQFECIAEYLNWNHSFTLSLSAYEPKEILKDEKLEEKIDEVLKRI